jgi:hypothetical protein
VFAPGGRDPVAAVVVAADWPDAAPIPAVGRALAAAVPPAGKDVQPIATISKRTSAPPTTTLVSTPRARETNATPSGFPLTQGYHAFMAVSRRAADFRQVRLGWNSPEASAEEREGSGGIAVEIAEQVAIGGTDTSGYSVPYRIDGTYRGGGGRRDRDDGVARA